MARSVKVGAFQAMQRTAARVESEPVGEAESAPMLTVPEQLAALELHVSDTPPYDEVVKRLKVRCSLLDIPALDEEIAADARRRCKMLPEPAPEPTIEVAVDPLADLLHAEDETGYPVVSDLPCDECGGEVMLRLAEEDRLLASRVAEGVEIEVLCDACAAAEDPGESGPGSAMFAEQTADEESGYDGPAFEPKAEDQAEDQAEPSTVVAGHFQALNIAETCTAEMSLSMITQRVRERSYRLSLDHGLTIREIDIVAEAERIWYSLDRKRSHTYSVEQGGTIRDWRRPDTTPDRGDVTKEHTITDGEPRFSGAGAGDAPYMSEKIPQDIAFMKRQFMAAPALANLADTLIDRHGFLEQLRHCTLEYKWARQGTNSQGKRSIGSMKRVSGVWTDYIDAQFIVYLAADTARLARFSDTQLEAALFHQLLHIGKDKKGNWIRVGHDFEGFGTEVRHYGPWTEDLKIGSQAFTVATQLGLDLDADDDEEGEAAEQAYFDAAGEEMERDRARDDGAGVLIHADGSPLTDDEIEAMERHELNDDDTDPDDGDDDYGQPDADAEYDDPLADADL